MEQASDLSGSQWTTSALYLQGISLVRRNKEWHHFDPLGTAQVITNGSAQVVSNNLYDVFGVLRYEQGSAQTPWRSKGVAAGEEGLSWIGSATFIPSRAVLITNGLKPLQVLIQQDRRNCKMELYACWGAAAAIAAACYTAVGVFWSICSGGCSGLAPWLTPLCIARCTWQARTLWIACTALFSTLMGICQSHYQQCVKEGGLP